MASPNHPLTIPVRIGASAVSRDELKATNLGRLCTVTISRDRNLLAFRTTISINNPRRPKKMKIWADRLKGSMKPGGVRIFSKIWLG